MMDVSNIQSLAALVNVMDALAKSDGEVQVLSVSIGRFGTPTIQLSHEFFIELFDEYELQEPQGSSRARVSTYVNGVEICAVAP